MRNTEKGGLWKESRSLVWEVETSHRLRWESKRHGCNFWHQDFPIVKKFFVVFQLLQIISWPFTKYLSVYALRPYYRAQIMFAGSRCNIVFTKLPNFCIVLIHYGNLHTYGVLTKVSGCVERVICFGLAVSVTIHR